MNRLLLFGDSFTAGNGCLPNEKYITYKTSDEDVIWPEIVANKFNLRLVNKGMGAYSNDKIIDSIIESYDLINENSLVIIGSTFYNRFDIPHENKLLTLSPTNLPESNEELLLHFISIMDSDLLEKRHKVRINFLQQQIKLKGAKCLVWEVEAEWKKYEKIREVTNNEIDDAHWSYKGHKDFANYIVNLINKPEPPKKLI
jgi:hypothetical protein